MAFTFTRNTLWAALALLATVAALAWAFWPRATAVETAQVSRGLFESLVEEDCKTHLSERYTLSSPVAGALERSRLREGDTVRQGEVVARLQPLQPGLLDARSQAEALARVQAALAGVQRAQALQQQSALALQDAWQELQRNHALADQGFVAEARLDSARLAVSSARSALDAASADQDRARHEYALARAALPAGASAPGGPAVLLRAPVDSVVLKLAQTDALTLAAGAPLLELGDLARMEVLCELLTTEAARLQAGSPARLAYGAPQPLQAVVRRVEPAGFTKVSALGVEEQRVNVHLEPLQPTPEWSRLGEGFRVAAGITLLRLPDVTLVPVGALLPQGAGMAVFVLQGRRVQLQPVQVGARNPALAWVQSGLQPGQAVVLYPPGQLVDGQAVRVRAP